MQAQEKFIDPFIDACAKIKNDISFIIEKVNSKKKFSSFENGLRRNSDGNEEAAEIVAAVCFQASIIGYGRAGEESRDHPIVTQFMTQMLDQLRDRLSGYFFEDVIRSLVQRCPLHQRGVSLATLMLALDVPFQQSGDRPVLLPSEQRRLLLLAAGLDQESSDPRGDAQLAAEEHFRDDESPLFENEDTKHDPRRSFREAVRNRRIRQCRNEIDAIYGCGSQFRAAQIAGRRAVSA